MFEPIKSTYRKPTLGEWLGHVYIGHKGDNYSHLAFTIITGMFGACGVGVGGPVFLQEAARGNLENSMAALTIMGVGLIPLAAQTWFLGAEGWSPEYQAQMDREDSVQNYIPPQL